jgi:DNA-directed RNA polymerase specialized sigma24 family protein
VIGAEFTGVLHAAKGGRVGAFTRLWADLNPVLTRYLRVVSVADADDVACESWVTVLRRLPAFEGDETAWRTLVFATARMHACDESQRLVWDAMVEPEDGPAVVPGPLPAGDEPFEDDELEGGPAHGLRMAIEAIRDLPAEQAEVVMLRRAALLPEDAVAELVGDELPAVHAAEEEALDSLGVDAELVTWALSAEPRPVELADEAAVLSVYRAVFGQPAPSASLARNGATATALAPAPVRTRAVATPAGTTPAGVRVIALRPPTWRTRAGAAAATSAAVLGLGALSAAAYQGVLPDPVQAVMHHVIGAPPADQAAAAPKPQRPYTAAPGTTTTRATTAQTSSPGTREVTFTTAGGAPAVVNLCKAWEADRGHGVEPNRSTAYRDLVAAAGSHDAVGPYCADAATAVAASATDDPTTGPATATSGTSTSPTTGLPATGAPTTTTQPPATATTTPPTTTPGTTTPPTTPTTDTERTRTAKPTKTGKPHPKPPTPATTSTTTPPTDDGRSGTATSTATTSTTTDPAPAETDTTTTAGQLTPSGRFTPGAGPRDTSWAKAKGSSTR